MKKRIKRSIIWKLPLNEFKRLVIDSKTFTEILQFFDLPAKGGNINTLKRRIIEEGIDFSHIASGLNANKGKKLNKLPTITEALVNGSKIKNSTLKKILLTNGLLSEKCYISGCPVQSPIWNGKPITLILDHINGIRDDNRLENLRLVCRNCDGQLPTFAGRNKRNPRKNCVICGRTINQHNKTNHCKPCQNKQPRPERRKTVHPAAEVLKAEIDSLGYSAVGRKYNVSDNAVRKWINQDSNIDHPH